MKMSILAAMLIALSCGATAYSQRMPISRSITATIKSGRTGDFMAALKEYNALYAKLTGTRPRLQYQFLTGEAPRYRLTVTYPDWAALDAPSPNANNAALSLLNSRITSCIESQTTVVAELLPDLSTPQLNEPPTLVRIARTRVRPDKVNEWMAIMKNEVLPAYKKAGRTLTVRQARFGAPTHEFYVSTRVANWADAGKNPIRESMGAEAYERMAAKLTALTTLRELDIVRYRADLSYSPTN